MPEIVKTVSNIFILIYFINCVFLNTGAKIRSDFVFTKFYTLIFATIAASHYIAPCSSSSNSTTAGITAFEPPLYIA